MSRYIARRTYQVSESVHPFRAATKVYHVACAAELRAAKPYLVVTLAAEQKAPPPRCEYCC